MSRKHVKSIKFNCLGGVRRLIVLVVALSLSLQSYITQTHIHAATVEIGGISQTAGHTLAKKPLNKAVACPLCQAIVHAGVFVISPAALVYLSFGWVRTARLVFAAPPRLDDLVHDWRSRAPPRD